MGTFSRPLTSNPGDRVARLQTMLDMPLPMMENLGQQFQQGALDSFGLGTALREGNIPQGNTQPAMPGIIPNPLDRVASLAQQAGAVLRGDEAEPSMSEEEYRSSPSFREDIPFEAGMTASRAEALAFFYDQKRVREFYGQKAPITSFVGQFFGQALDPINYVPVFGPAAEAAAVARLGTVAGRALISSGDAAINTSAFALMSSGLREQFGDDVGWEAIVNEIAMSALIGGAFGGVMGGVSQIALRRANARDQRIIADATDKLSTLQSLKESRAVLNEAVADLTNGVPVNLSKNSGDILARVSNQSLEVSRGLRDLTEASAAVPENAPRVAVTPSGLRVEYQPEVVELDSLTAATGALQVRNRNSQASAAQVEQIATALDPARLMPSAEADSGAPIVGDDGVIDSGNGRVMAIRRAAEAYPDRYNEYRKAIEAAGYSTEGMSRPVLISRRTTPLSPQARAKFNAEANAPRAAQLSAVELAAMDRDAVAGALDVLDPSPVTSAANRPFVQRFIGNLTPSARGALVDPDGRLNADGVRRIENALIAAAYGDVDVNVVRRFAEATDDNTRAIVGAMSDAAPAWAAMREAVKRGEVSPEFDTTKELTEALRMMGIWREQAAREKRPVAKVIAEGIDQFDIELGAVSPEVQVFIRAFHQNDNFTKAAGRDTIADFLNKVASATQELGRPQLFGAAGIDRVEMLANVAGNEQWNLFTPNGAEDGIGADGPGLTPDAQGGQGAGQGAEGSQPVGRQEDGSLQDREAIAQNLMRMADEGDIEGIKASPELATLVADMNTRQHTEAVEGYGSNQWAAERVYQTDDGPITGIEAAADYLLENARTLASKETGAPAFKVARERKAVIVIGPPAAGKSTIANQIALKIKAAIPDADEAKKIMPEYDNGMGSSATHEESSFLTSDYVVEMLKRNGENMVIPKVGGKAKSISGLAEELRQWGYTVDLVLMDVSPAEAFRRMVGRFVSTGRLIPPAYFDEVSTAPAKVYDELAALGEFDGYAKVKSERDRAPVVSGSTIKSFDFEDGAEIPVAGAAGGSDGRAGVGADAQAPGDGPATARPVPISSRQGIVIDGVPMGIRNPDAPEAPVAETAQLSMLPNEQADAEGRIARDESLDDTARAHGVNPRSGGFMEQADIEEIRNEGRLTGADEAELAAADQTYAHSEAYGRALDAAIACVIRG